VIPFLVLAVSSFLNSCTAHSPHLIDINGKFFNE
jgi:hypothetical protein